MKVLVVGGAGYIGSHCVRQLNRAGHQPIVLDNLVFGHRDAVAPGVPFYEAELGDEGAVSPILAREQVEVVMHFAAFAYVGESVTDPLKYYFNNVDDLSRAHIAVFDRLLSPGAALFYNLGTGTPTSVREVIAAVEKVTGERVPVVTSPRRPGDPPALYADAGKARAELGWQVEYPDIEAIVASAWQWHRNHPNGYGDQKHHGQ